MRATDGDLEVSKSAGEGDLSQEQQRHPRQRPTRKCSCFPARTPPPKLPSASLLRILSELPHKYRWYTAVGCVAALAQGAVFPAFTLVFGTLFNIFVTETPSAIRARAADIAGIFVGIGVFNLAVAFLSYFFLGLVGEACGVYYRRRLWAALLQQDVGFVDEEKSGNLIQRLSSDIETLQNGTGVKCGAGGGSGGGGGGGGQVDGNLTPFCVFRITTWVMNMGTLLAALIIAFVYSWKLSLVLISVSPLILLGGLIQSRLLQQGQAKQAESFRDALSFAIEVLASFRTVASFVWESHAEELYNEKLRGTKKSRLHAVVLNAVAYGFSLFVVFAVYALGFWYGAQLVADGPANGGILLGDMLIVFFSIVMAAMGLSQALSVQGDFAKARVAGHFVLETINRVPSIDAHIGSGVRDVALQGQIALDNVHFRYPSRPAQAVLAGVSLHIPAGSVVGVVGASGSGKSTLLLLLERFYDVTSGCVRFDGRDVREFDLAWLRRHVGLVSQEPKLFDMSIEDNIRVGRPDATQAQVEAAAQAANCHDFIMELKHGYATRVGEGGGQLSGGQRQRVAIARAFVKNPKVLLLDEATAQLDSHSEEAVQRALDKLMVGRTTIQIAHRLSTVRDCDMICVMRQGELVEVGTHAELLAMRGHYFALVALQMDPAELRQLDQSSQGVPKADMEFHDLYRI